MSVKTSIQGSMDRLAAIWQAALSIATGGTSFWNRTDAAGDEAFENRVKGSQVTALDTKLANSQVFGAVFREYLGLLDLYFVSDLSLPQSSPLSSWLTSVALRIPYGAAEVIVDAKGAGARLPTYQVFPKGIRPNSGSSAASSGMHLIGRLTGTSSNPTWADVDAGIDTTRIVGAGLLIVNEDATPTPGTLVMTATRQDGTTVDLSVTLSATTQYAQTKLGSQAVGAAGAASGQDTVPVAATAQFKAGEYVLMYHDDATQEIAKIAEEGIVENTSLTFDGNLVNSYVENDLVIPLYTDVAYKSGTLGDTKKLAFYAMPDRAIAL